MEPIHLALWWSCSVCCFLAFMAEVLCMCWRAHRVLEQTLSCFPSITQVKGARGKKGVEDAASFL